MLTNQHLATLWLVLIKSPGRGHQGKRIPVRIDDPDSIEDARLLERYGLVHVAARGRSVPYRQGRSTALVDVRITPAGELEVHLWLKREAPVPKCVELVASEIDIEPSKERADAR